MTWWRSIVNYFDIREPIMFDEFKVMYSALADKLDAMPHTRATSLALTKLEEAYMWIGKALRDDQIARNGSAELMEQRKDEARKPRPESGDQCDLRDEMMAQWHKGQIRIRHNAEEIYLSQWNYAALRKGVDEILPNNEAW